MEELNEQQGAAVRYDGRNLLVLAGAGTGKTHTIIARARHLLKSGVNPSRIMILSFTRKSAKEIVARLESSLPDGMERGRLRGQTFHSWCMELIESYPEIFNFGRFTVIDEDDRESAFRLVCGRFFKKSNYIKPGQLAEVYSYAVNSRCNLSTALKRRLFSGSHTSDELEAKVMQKLPVYSDVIKRYLAFKAERRYLDYDDILQKVAVGLKKNPEAARFVASHYDHILIDEMQDTNPLQYTLLESFWNSCNLFCVGDDAQSIYGFRGADFKSIHSFSRRVPEAEVLKLTINYRSTQEILNISNWLLAESPLNYGKQLKAHRGEGELPEMVHYRDEWDQARDIVMRIKNSIGGEGLEYKDNMVLSRSGRGLRTVEACLVEAQIPYTVFGGSSLMQSAHVRDVAALLRLVANSRDELAWQRYLCLFPGVGDITAAKIVDRIMAAEDIYECANIVASWPRMDPKASLILLSVAELSAKVEQAVREACHSLEPVLATRYKDDWSKRRPDLELLWKISEAADSLAAFLADYMLDPSLQTGKKEGAQREDGVTLTTIHSAKGLEARYCYLINVNYSQYPSPRAVLDGEDAVEEERRCLYVALTRAKDRLVIYRSHKAARVLEPGGEEARQMYFLNGIYPSLYKFVDLAGGGAYGRWEAYRGGGITLDECDDFDFS